MHKIFLRFCFLFLIFNNILAMREFFNFDFLISKKQEKIYLPPEIWLNIIENLDIYDEAFIYLGLIYGISDNKSKELMDKICTDPSNTHKWLENAKNINKFETSKNLKSCDSNFVKNFKYIISKIDNINQENIEFYGAIESGSIDKFVGKINLIFEVNFNVFKLQDKNILFTKRFIKLLNNSRDSRANNLKKFKKLILIFSNLKKRINFYKYLVHKEELNNQVLNLFYNVFGIFLTLIILPLILFNIFKNKPEILDQISDSIELLLGYSALPFFTLLINYYRDNVTADENKFTFLKNCFNQYNSLIKFACQIIDKQINKKGSYN